MYDLATTARGFDNAALHGALAYATSRCYPLWLGNGDALLRQGDYQDAFFLYYHDTFLDGDSTIEPPYNRAGVVDALRLGLDDAAHGKFSDAYSSLQRAARNAPGFTDAHFYLGDLLLAEGHPSNARSEWEQALQSRGADYPKHRDSGPDDTWMSALLMYELPPVHR